MNWRSSDKQGGGGVKKVAQSKLLIPETDEIIYCM
jgi:hypothetical protein